MRASVLVFTAAIVLSGCTPAVTTLRVSGTPSIGIDIPLHTVACTTTGSCFALGTSGSATVPSTVGQYRQNNGTWSSLAVPSASSAVITAKSCWTTGCLVGGVEATGALVWDYNASSQSVSVLKAPAGGQGVRALSCYADAACAMVVDRGVNKASLLSFTTDGGVTWSPGTAMDWTSGETVTTLACTDPLACMAAAISSSNTLDVEVTHDAGLTWTPRTTPSSWSSLSSLMCVKLQCVGLSTSPQSSFIVRTKTFGRRWETLRLPARANALACSTLRHCALGGERTSGDPWLATLDGMTLDVASLQYVPSPIADVACATSVCAAIGVTTVLTLRP